MAYQYVWCLMGGALCEYQNEQFKIIIPNIMISSENEFAFKYANTSDYTGGYHGDERIDIDASSYIKFLLDGCPINISEMQSDINKWCNNFAYIEYSTLHATSEDGENIINDHPIIAYHYKETIIGEKIKIRNVVRFVTSLNIVDYFSGLFCMGKNFARYAEISGQIFDTSRGSNSTFVGNDRTAEKVNFYNEIYKVGASVESCIKRTNFSPNFSLQCDIWDRTNDTKYYRHLGSFSVSNNNIIETEMLVEYK